MSEQKIEIIIDRKKATNAAAFGYSMNMLNFLLSIGVLTVEEYNRILLISAEHYEMDNGTALLAS